MTVVLKEIRRISAGACCESGVWPRSALNETPARSSARGGSGRQLGPTPHFFNHSTNAPEVRGLQIRQHALHIDQTASRGVQQNSQSASDGKSSFTCDADSKLLRQPWAQTRARTMREERVRN